MQTNTHTFLQNGKVVSGNEHVSNAFNQHFVNIGPSLADKIETIPNIDHRHFMRERLNYSLFLEPVTYNEILQVVRQFKNKRSKGVDDINMVTVKKLIHSLLVPLCHVFNLSLKNGIFPDSMKMAKVIPFYKSGNVQEFSNYRPVSLLPQFSKILEKLFYKRLLSFIEKHSILSNNQYGFRANHSTAYAITELVESITDAVDDNKYSVGVFIDLKKAFDTIDHKILLDKLEIYGIRGTVLRWIESYLCNRKQFVLYNDANSGKLLLKCGVPQGSILGPLLFILYINDICNISKLLMCILFADDTNLLYANRCPKKLQATLNSELTKLRLWFKINKLSRNIDKTNCIVFGSKCKHSIEIFIEAKLITQVYDTKFLGVFIDDNLTWKS